LNPKDSSISITIDKISAHFSAAHALISPQYEEGLHGHNYNVEVTIEGKIDHDGILIDYVFLEKLLNQIIAEWDHYVLIPSRNDYLKIRKKGLNLELDYGDRFYSIPENEIRILDCINVTTESVSRIIGEILYERLKKEDFWVKIRTLNVCVWETPKYKATFSINTKN
jgi:6-pyruvoyltetrahydropterin/6-carboxytetrahydropterin synthase